MNFRTRGVASTLSIALLCVLAAGCDGARVMWPSTASSAADADADAKKSFMGRLIGNAIAEASLELETENTRVGRTHINIGGRSYYGADQSTEELPRAEITPQGEFLIEQEAVATDARQRELLLDHRRDLIDIAQAGLAIGAQGADVAGSALTGIGEALFGGEDGRQAYEARIEAEAARIKGEASRLCALLPKLYDSQQSLADALPAFAPYATMTLGDISDCGTDTGEAVADASDGTTA